MNATELNAAEPPAVTLGRVLEGVPLASAIPASYAAAEITGLAYDSRKVQPGFLFFAFAGAKTDGAQFAAAAMSKGAQAIVSDRPAPAGFSGTWLQAARGREALAVAARNFYNKPDQRLALTAITGTNGKTTSSTLIDSILRAAGKTTALIGTIEYHLAGQVLPAVNTTPESLDLFAMFAQLEQLGGTHATLEASSHALDLGRIYAMQFHTAASPTSRATTWIITTPWRRTLRLSSCYSIPGAVLLHALQF